VYSEYDYVAISLRRNCDPNDRDSVIDCYNDYWYSASTGGYVPAGTYYFVIDTPDGSTEYYYEFCVGED